ncbi:hypothetical protein OUZ56_033353 [Daphnia magna]|uniref:Uncharacterized protein n=1 Tax=Daphnia magna TaxID=35525 RepID=A0ABQ9ZXN3_9CRUS|nr:hypothetical protein OUZ56_033353 [Daphnia magna]
MTHLRQERKQKSGHREKEKHDNKNIFKISEKEERKRSERRIGGIEEEFGTKGLLRLITSMVAWLRWQSACLVSRRSRVRVSLGPIRKFMEDTDIVSKLNYINGRMA